MISHLGIRYAKADKFWVQDADGHRPQARCGMARGRVNGVAQGTRRLLMAGLSLKAVARCARSRMCRSA
jgi:hypothetical protein